MIAKPLLWQIENVFQKHRTSSFQPQLDLTNIRQNYDSGGCNKWYNKFYSQNEFTLQLGKTAVFTDEKNVDHTGLANQQLVFDSNNRPIYLVDNHHEALFAFVEIFKETRNPLNIVHIDAHPDDAKIAFQASSLTLKNTPQIIKQCRVSDYLDCGEKGGIIKNVISVTQSSEFERFELPKNPYVLNLDLDIYGPEGTAVSAELKTKVIAKAFNNANAVIMATSPGFMEQSDAFELVKIFTKP
jgi:hypothetical protein